MKKLMTTLFAAAAAFGLRAADPGAVSGTSFEGQPAGDYIITDGTGELPPALEEGQTYWKTNETATLTIINGKSASGNLPGGINKRPDDFINSTQNQYLKIKTTLGNPVTRNVSTNGLGIAIKKDGEGAYDGLYFDSLVKFTAFDSNPEIILGNDGKLAIWLKEELNDNDVPTATNLVITAGYLVNTMAKVVPTNYVCEVSGVDFADGGWHRVTVKAINTIYKTAGDFPGFVVFVDGHYARCEDGKGITETLTDVAKTWNDVDALFPSAVQLAADKQMITSVSFDGQGEVDDLVFTTKAPEFAEDEEYFTITLDSNIASVTYEIDGLQDTITETKSIEYTEGMKVRIVEALGKDGYMFDVVTPGDGVGSETIDDVVWYGPTAAEQGISVGSKVSGAYIVGGDKYETLAEAVGAIPTLSGTDFEVMLTANAELTGALAFTTSGKTVVLDLAGYNITGPTTAGYVVQVGQNGSLEITNSTETVGHIITNRLGQAAVVAQGALTIRDGIYDGKVQLGGNGTKTITGGKFQIEANEAAAVKSLLDAAVAVGCGDTYELAPELLLPPTYYVITEKVTPTTVKVDFINGELIVATTNIEVGTTLVAPEVSKTGYTLDGWYYGEPATKWNFENPVTEALTLTAGWTINSYTVTFVVDGASSTITKDYNTTIAAAEVPETQARTGYTGAWDTNPEGQTVTGDITYTYTYTADNYTITYMYGENELSGLTPATYTITNAVTLPSEVDLGVAGVSFEAWTNAEGQVVANWAAGATGNKTFYAQVTVPGPAEKYEPGEEGITPPTGKTAAEFAAVINADKAKYIDTPSTADVADTAAYLALFQAVADTEKGTVSIGLTTAAAETEQIAANETAADIVSDLTATEVEIDAQPGLWYSISVSSTLGGLAAGEGTRVMATDSNVAEGKLTLDIPVIDDSTPARFYKVNVNLADKPSQD